ncbi:MAG: hypothetical protein ACTSVB_04025 [Candidatus Heimdallarchaeaceae archaeon]
MFEKLVEEYKNMKREDLIRLAEKQRQKIHEAKIVLKAIEEAIVFRAENNLE